MVRKILVWRAPDLCCPSALTLIRGRASATGLLAPFTCWISDVNCEIKSSWQTLREESVVCHGIKWLL